MYQRQGGAGPSCKGWPPLPTPLAGHKHAVVPSQSPKKTDAKVTRQIQVQYQLSQQDLQPAPARVCLPSAPMGAPRSFETTKRRLALGSNEWERLDREVRSSQELFTQYGGIVGTTRVVLAQPAQPSGVNEPRVPQLQEDELRMHNAGVNLHDQARVQNVTYFVEWDKLLKKQQPALMDAMDWLTSSIAGQQLPPQQGSSTNASQLQDVLPPPPTDD